MRSGHDIDLVPYIPRLLIDWQSDSPGVSFRAIDGTLAFVDLSGFTRMSERLARKGKVGAEELTDVINSSFTRLLTVAWDDGGGLLKFGGDALLLFFSGEGHAARACRSALGMRQALRHFGRIQTSAGLVSLRMSAGVHSGTFHFSLVGDLHRELIITGPAASQTVTMEAVAGAGEIVVSAATRGLIGPERALASRHSGYLLTKAPPAPSWRADLPSRGRRRGLAAFLPEALRHRVGVGLQEGEHRQVSVAFLHFGGIDALIDGEGPGEVQARLDGLICSCQSIASEYGICILGTDIASDGGKIILTAGAPESSGNDEERTLRALRAIADGSYGLEIRVGVNRGRVFAGEIGPKFRRTYTIMGDTVNLAARLMQHALPGQVLATADVLERSATVFEVTALEPFAAKGKTQPVRAYSVGRVSGPKPRRGERPLPMVGRQEEMASLMSALRSASRGRGRLVEIVGEAGIGKSRFVAEMNTRRRNALYLAVACEQYESSTPYFAFRDLLRPLMGIQPDDDAKQSSERLRQCIRSTAPQLEPWLPLLATPLDLVVPPTRESRALDPAFRKTRLHWVVAELLERLLNRPSIIVFEDVHWMDEASSHLLEYLARGVGSRPWLLCVTRRPQATGLVLARAFGRLTVQLEPLSPQGSLALAAAAVGEVPLPAHQIAAMADRAGGNPLFLQQLIAACRSPGGLEALPDSVEAAITAQIDKLAPQERQLLRYASVIGPSFSLQLLDSIVPGEVPPPGAWHRLSAFVQPEDGGSFRFRHALFRDVAYEGLPYRRRRDLHQRVGTVLERQARRHPEEVAELLSLHFHRAQRYEKAWRYSLVAGERARVKFANIEAAEFYRRALDASARLDCVDPGELMRVWEALGDVQELAGLYAEAGKAYRSGRRLAVGQGSAATQFLLKEGIIRDRLGQYTQALRWYGRGLRVIDRRQASHVEVAQRVQLALSCAAARYRQGRYSDCIHWCERVIADAKPIDDQAGLARAYYLLDAAYTDLGKPESATYRAFALPIYEELGDWIGQANVLNNLGIDAYYEGRWDESLAFYQRSNEARQRAGDVVGAATATNNIGEILSDRGQVQAAESLFQEALRVWRAAGYPVGIAIATSNLGRAAARRGRMTQARRLLNEALLGFQRIGAENLALETNARIAENLVMAGKPDLALPLIDATLKGARAMGGMAVLQAMLHRLRGYALLQAGDFRRASGWLEESLELGRAVHSEYEVALTLQAIAHLAGLTGRGNADQYSRESASTLARLGIISTPTIPLPVAATPEMP